MHVIGLDHRRASAAQIALLGRDPEVLLSRIVAADGVHGAVVLATCARTEVYLDAPRFHDAHRAAIDAWSADCDLPASAVTERVTARRGATAVEHLFRVASGLESAVVGEDQIVGQVRAALLHARSHRATTRTLDIAFENALRVSREARPLLVRQATSPRTIASAAIEQATRSLCHPIGVALVIGTGAFAETCIGDLRARGAHTILVHSPSGRAVPDCASVSAGELATAVALADVTIAASGRGRPVLTEGIVTMARSQRARPVILLDLAVGDVDTAIADLPDVHVIGLDDVRSTATDTATADDLVREQAAALMHRIADGELDEVIVTLRTHVEAAAARAGDPELASALRRLTNTLLHEPTQRARLAAQRGELDRFRSAVETLFGSTSGSAA